MTDLPVLHAGDCRETMAAMALAGDAVDSIVCDPPYDLKFMGKTWDGTGIAFDPETWRAAFDVLKPGGHLVAFGGTRTYHRMAVAIEDAGFEIRDCLMWVYGSGFPKSLDVSKAIDKAAGAEREVVGPGRWNHVKGTRGRDGGLTPDGFVSHGGTQHVETAPATPEAAAWSGWGTALKPAVEPIVLARKPLVGTVAENVLTHGVGGINIDACRVASDKPVQIGAGIPGFGSERDDGYEIGTGRRYGTLGRWPANVLHDGSDEVLETFAAFGDKAGFSGGGRREGLVGKAGSLLVSLYRGHDSGRFYGDSGSAARFFYCAKAGKGDRAGSKHPTVKPLALMRWLCRLVTPPGGRILDPFAGSGTTLVAAYQEGFAATGCEMEPEYIADIERRLAALYPADELALFA